MHLLLSFIGLGISAHILEYTTSTFFDPIEDDFRTLSCFTPLAISLLKDYNPFLLVGFQFSRLNAVITICNKSIVIDNPNFDE